MEDCFGGWSTLGELLSWKSCPAPQLGTDFSRTCPNAVLAWRRSDQRRVSRRSAEVVVVCCWLALKPAAQVWHVRRDLPLVVLQFGLCHPVVGVVLGGGGVGIADRGTDLRDVVAVTFHFDQIRSGKCLNVGLSPQLVRILRLSVFPFRGKGDCAFREREIVRTEPDLSALFHVVDSPNVLRQICARRVRVVTLVHHAVHVGNSAGSFCGGDEASAPLRYVAHRLFGHCVVVARGALAPCEPVLDRWLAACVRAERPACACCALHPSLVHQASDQHDGEQEEQGGTDADRDGDDDGNTLARRVRESVHQRLVLPHLCHCLKRSRVLGFTDVVQ